MTVDFITFCHWRDYERLYAPGELASRVESHKYEFDKIWLVHQNLLAGKHEMLYRSPDHFPNGLERLFSEGHPDILAEFGLSEDDPIAEEKTHGPSAPHYWKHHCTNHLLGLKISNADYIVFSDCDCRIVGDSAKSWVYAGIHLLQKYPEVLIVSPSDGGTMAEKRLPGKVRLTQNVSQQLFLCERERFKSIDFNIPWNWEFLAPGAPMQEYYYMLEGRIWRYMHHNNLYRAILPKQYRYWHDQW